MLLFLFGFYASKEYFLIELKLSSVRGNGEDDSVMTLHTLPGSNLRSGEDSIATTILYQAPKLEVGDYSQSLVLLTLSIHLLFCFTSLLFIVTKSTF